MLISAHTNPGGLASFAGDDDEEDMFWALLGTACVAYVIVEFVNLRELRETAGRPYEGPTSTRGSAAPPRGAAPDVQFGSVGEAPEVTLDRRTRNDPYLAQLKRRGTDPGE